MMVDDPSLDAFESASHAQLRALELSKIEAFITNLGKMLLSLSRWESQC